MLKRTAKGQDSLVAPPAKRQTLLTFKPVTPTATGKEVAPLQSGFRLLDEGYIAALVKRHRSDDRYRSYFRDNSLESVCTTIHNFLSPALMKVLDDRKEADLEAILSIGGDLLPNHAGWYMNVLTDTTDPTWFALYAGQSIKVKGRISDHRANYLTKDSLHYFVWKQPGKKSTFVSLGRMPDGTNNMDLVLNIGEQLLGTIFQALPEGTLPDYLPPGIEVQLPHRGLMVGRPMNQGHKDTTEQTPVNLWLSSNSLTRLYAKGHNLEALKKVRQRQVEEQQVGQIATKRSKSKKAHLFRSPDISLGDLPSVLRWCRICKTTQSLDPAPIYEISTGRYIARKAPCGTCVETAPGRLSRSQNGRKTTYHIPVDPNVAHIRQEDIS